MLDFFFFLLGAKFKLEFRICSILKEKKNKPIQLSCALGLVENLWNTERSTLV